MACIFFFAFKWLNSLIIYIKFSLVLTINNKILKCEMIGNYIKTMSEIIQSIDPTDGGLLSVEELKRQLKVQQEEFFHQQQEFLNRESLLANSITPSSSNSFSFTQGLIVGQLSVIVVIGIFIKFFVFQDASNYLPVKTVKDGTGVVVKHETNNKSGNTDNDSTADSSHEPNLSSILEKTYYDVDNHPSESLDWFNVLIAQTISQLRTEALISDNIFHSLNDFLMKLNFPNYLDSVRITEIDIGDDFPIFSNCRIKQSQDDSGRLEAKIDVDLSDTITLGVETKLLLNHPRPMVAALPVQLSVSLVRFSGCLAVSLISPNDQDLEPNNSDDLNKETDQGLASKETKSTSNIEFSSNHTKKSQKESGTAIRFSFSPDYRLEFNIKSLIGSRAKLQDVPKISSLIESKLRYWFVERCVEPRFQVVKIPSLWPRKENTREVPE